MGATANFLGFLGIRNQTPIRYGSGAVAPVGFGGFLDPTYEQCARAFMTNEIVNAAIRLLATSAAEPCIEGRRWRRERPTYIQARKMANVRHAGPVQGLRRDFLVRNGFYEELPNHPLVKLVNDPNPFTTRAELMRTLVMDRYISGNAFLFKARSDLGNVAELWRLRPDRVKVIPGADGIPIGYQYTVEQDKRFIPLDDMIHWKEPHPLSDYVGLSPMSAIMPRVQVDSAMRSMLGAFYEGGGTGPGAILTLSGKLPEDAKTEIRGRLRQMVNHPGGFREVLILEQGTSDYKRLGLDRGLTDAVPKDVNAVMESRIGLPFGIPGSILGLLIGYESSSYANKRADWQVLWDVTMTPLMSDFDDGLTRGLCPEFGGIDELQFDLGDIRALQEDIDSLQDRARKNVATGLWTIEEGRGATGVAPEPAGGEHFLIPSSAVLTDTLEPPEPTVAPPTQAEEIAAHYRVQFGKIGRPALLADPGARATYDRAIRVRNENPTWSWLDVATEIGISERQLRRYRSQFE